VRVLKDLQPWYARPLATPIFTLLLGDRRISAALGVGVPPVVAERATDAALRAYGFVKRQRSGEDAATVFTPGMAVAGLYPHGYGLGELGPR
jgi:hypothetical protein